MATTFKASFLYFPGADIQKAAETSLQLMQEFDEPMLLTKDTSMLRYCTQLFICQTPGWEYDDTVLSLITKAHLFEIPIKYVAITNEVVQEELEAAEAEPEPEVEVQQAPAPAPQKTTAQTPPWKAKR